MNKKRLPTLMGGTKKHWWKKAGVNPIAVYTAIGAANIASSLINLVTPGTNDLVQDGTVTFSPTAGWSGFSGTNMLHTAFNLPTPAYTVILDCTNLPPASANRIWSATGASETGVQLYVGSTVYLFAGDTALGVGDDVTEGVVSATGTGKLRINKTQYIASIAGSPAAAAIYFGNRAAGDRVFYGKIKSILVYNVNLTDSQCDVIVDSLP